MKERRNHRGLYRFRQGDFDTARRLSLHSLSIRREQRKPRLIARALHNLGNVESAVGNNDAAWSYYEEARALNHEEGAEDWEAGILGRMGEVLLLMGRAEEALSYLEKALALNRKVQNSAWEAIDLQVLGDLHFGLGQSARARECYFECLGIRLRLGDEPRLAVTLASVAAMAATDDAPLAARLLTAAEELRRRVGLPLLPNERSRLDAQLQAARTLLSAPSFQDEWRSGGESTWKTSAEEALRWLRTPPLGPS
ncbi:MAG: hypothetical protein QOE70_6543 [Chthoniobacter sp.]|nr:hypothetical protein [Chthoniobacter sp.]